MECGLIQEGHTILENYRLNQEYLQKIKPSNIDMIIVGHMHIDHIGLIPSLYKNGKCNARIIVPKYSTAILETMLLDSAYINTRDVELLNHKRGTAYQPLYTEDDVHYVMQYVEEYESNEVIALSDSCSIRYTPAGHILLSQQIELFITCNGHTKKLLFTSDLGNTITQDSRVYVEKFQPVNTAQIAFVESTYSAASRTLTKEDFQKDMEKIKTVITQFCIDSSNRVLIPTFSLDRCPYMLWILYSLFGKDKDFHVPIIVDSPLTINLLNIYSSILQGEKKEIFDQVMSWENLQLITEPEESKAAISDPSSKVILSSSGMLTAGRSIKWCQSILPRYSDCILFCGYTGENTLGWKIKHSKQQKTISINGKPIPNRCQIVNLKSFSSHMQHQELVKYYKGIHCDKIYLVHGNTKDVLEFQKELSKEIHDSLRTTKVIVPTKGTKISL